MTTLGVIVVLLASFRITRLIIDDTIVEPLRYYTVDRLRPESKLRELLRCYWCLGLWISLIATGIYAIAPRITPWLALPFAISAVIGILGSVLP